MPTNQTTYNSRVTDEALEKKFRDSFKAQGGAELVNDLFASGVIVPVVDFSDAAAGSALRADLQTALDTATTVTVRFANGTSTVVSTPGFYKVLVNYCIPLRGPSQENYYLDLTDGITTAKIWSTGEGNSTTNEDDSVSTFETVVFVRSGYSLRLHSVNGGGSGYISVSSRQIADSSGNLVNPLGFTSS